MTSTLACKLRLLMYSSTCLARWSGSLFHTSAAFRSAWPRHWAVLQRIGHGSLLSTSPLPL
eukprot:2484338-Amphidinium_carterae.1